MLTPKVSCVREKMEEKKAKRGITGPKRKQLFEHLWTKERLGG